MYMVLYVQYRSNCPTGTKPNLLASYIQPTFSQLDGDPPSHMPTPEPSSSPSPTTSPSTSTVTLSQSSPPVTPPCFSRPYTHPPPLPPTADSELMGIPSKSANFCCHCRTECPCIFGRPCTAGPAEAAQLGRVDVHTFATGVLVLGATSNHRTSIEHPL